MFHALMLGCSNALPKKLALPKATMKSRMNRQRWCMAGAALCLAPQFASAGVIFSGVAAGDATSSDAILWTRADNGGSTTPLNAQVSTDAAFGSGVLTYSGTTAAAADYTLKLDATGLSGNTQYFYRFTDGTAVSQVGSFTTAPSSNIAAPVKFGFSGDIDGRFRPYPSVSVWHHRGRFAETQLLRLPG